MKKYLEIYNHYKVLIDSQQMRRGDKMPSIRKCTALHGVSKTTVESAYFALAADGYIISHEKSGFFVQREVKNNDTARIEEKEAPKFNLKDWNADAESFDFNLWRRYMKSALRENERLLNAGEAQGELQLRETIASYIRRKRNVVASPSRIVVGAGVQSLLHILCSIMTRKCVSLPDSKSFLQAKTVFENYGYEISTRNINYSRIFVSC